MRHAILLIYDEPEKKLVNVPCEDPLIRFLDKIMSMKSMEAKELDCFCIKNSSVDRAKILIRYLRKYLKFNKDQITLIRASGFKNASEIRERLVYLFRKRVDDDILFYYTGHGISNANPGWSLGRDKDFHYSYLQKLFQKFQGTLVCINDTCHGLAIDQSLKILSGRYLLFGASRRGCLSSESIIDPVLGYWFHRKIADPKVACVRKFEECILDLPAYSSRGNGYNCERCGGRRKFTLVKTFNFDNAPSLRRGSELDSIWFPEK